MATKTRKSPHSDLSSNAGNRSEMTMHANMEKAGLATSPAPAVASVSNSIDYEYLAGMLTTRSLREIDDPVDPYRIDSLLTHHSRQISGKISTEFERDHWCKGEDRRRSLGLRAAVASWSPTRVATDLEFYLSLAQAASDSPDHDVPDVFMEIFNSGIQRYALDLAARLAGC